MQVRCYIPVLVCVLSVGGLFTELARGEPKEAIDLLPGNNLEKHWVTKGNWTIDKEGVVTLTPREGEKGWSRWDAYLHAFFSYQQARLPFSGRNRRPRVHARSDKRYVSNRIVLTDGVRLNSEKSLRGRELGEKWLTPRFDEIPCVIRVRGAPLDVQPGDAKQNRDSKLRIPVLRLMPTTTDC